MESVFELFSQIIFAYFLVWFLFGGFVMTGSLYVLSIVRGGYVLTKRLT